METRNVKMTLETARRWKEMGGEYEQVAVETFPELADVKNEWEDRFDGKGIDGFFISNRSEILGCEYRVVDGISDKNLFKTEKQAKSALAYSQLTQLMALPEYNGDWVPDWENRCESKYCIIQVNKEIKIDLFYEYAQKICFKSEELAKLFLKNNLDLLKQYFEL